MVFKDSRGLTLVELLVGMAVMAIVMTAALNIFGTSFKVYRSSTNQTGDIQQARIALNTINDELRFASDVTIVNPAEVTYVVGVQSRSVELGTGADAGHIIVAYNGVEVRRVGQGLVSSLNFAWDVDDIKLLKITLVTSTPDAITNRVTLDTSVRPYS